MKQIFFIAFILLGSLQTWAQDREAHREKIKALKTAYITEGLALTSQEAQRFWPVYNKFEEKRRELHRREHANIKNLDCISEQTANQMVQEYVQIEKEDYLLKKDFYAELKTMFSAKRIIQLKKAEDDFHRKLLKEYRERQSKDVQ